MARTITTNYPYVLKDLLEDGTIKLGDCLYLNDGQSSDYSKFYILDYNADYKDVLLGRRTNKKSSYNSNVVKYQYQGSDLANWIETTYYNGIPNEYKAIAKSREITNWTTNVTSNNKTTISKKVFAPASAETGDVQTSEVGDESRAYEGSDKAGGRGTFGYFRDNGKAEYTKGKTILRTSADVNASRDTLRKKISDSGDFWTRSRNKARVSRLATYIKSSDGQVYLGTMGSEFYVFVCLNIDSRVIVSRNNTGIWLITPDFAPTTPTVTYKTYNVENNQAFDIIWNAASDSVTPTTYTPATKVSTIPIRYKITETIITPDNKTVTNYRTISDTVLPVCYDYNEAKTVYYKITALDQWDNYSSESETITVSVTNNTAPYEPYNIGVLGTTYKNDSVTINWLQTMVNGLADADNNFAGYNIYKNENGVRTKLNESVVTATNFTVSTGNESSIILIVTAVDKKGAESSGATATIALYDKQTLELDFDGSNSTVEDGEELEFYGTFDSTSQNNIPLTFAYKYGDNVPDGAGYVAELTFSLNGADKLTVTKEITNATTTKFSGTKFSIDVSEEEVRTLPSGEYKVTCKLKSTNNEIKNTVTFTKKTTRIAIEIKGGIEVPNAENGNVEQFLLNIAGTAVDNENNTVEVSVTRNAGAANPTWMVLDNTQYNVNKFVEFDSTCEKGCSMGIRLAIDIDSSLDISKYSNQYISSITGMFGRNWFEWIANRLDALEAKA